MISKSDQIKALLNHKAYELATCELKKSHMALSKYEDIFTVSRSDIDLYIAKNGIPKHTYCTIGGLHICEGIHYIKRGMKWHIFWYERNIKFNEQEYTSEKEAEKILVDLILDTAGTGINFKR